MKNTDDVLDEVLGVLDPVEKELGIEKMLTPTISRPSKEKEDVDADYEYQRENFYIYFITGNSLMIILTFNFF